MFNYQPHFPYNKSRKEQDTAINFALDAFINKKKRYVVIEAGTGVGKSAIGVTIARYLATYQAPENPECEPGAYFLTTQKVLQEQYIKDFSSINMLSLKSSSNYRCKYYKMKDCGTALRELKVSQNKAFKACCGGGCNYKIAKRSFLETKLGVTNFAYFLAETNYSGHLKPRQLLVVDECHNTELQLSRFVEVVVTENFAKRVLKLKLPEKLNTANRVIAWIKTSYLPKLLETKAHMENQIEKFSIGSKMDQFIAVAKQYDLIDKHACKIERFLKVYDKENWIMNINKTDKQNTLRFEFKPIDVAPFSEDNLFRSGDKVLLMSATVMNKDAFCETLGIEKNEVEFISIPSPFPIENRPIIFSPISSMTFKNIDKGLPKMVQAIKAILKEHKNEKGIIHTHSYKIAHYIKKNIRSSRLLIHDSSNRDKILFKHMNGKEPTVLLSPSMSEGVDLKGDISRFQILCKVPYPYLGDQLVKKRMHRWRWWYPLQTAKSIVQSVGRSVRSSDDQAITYILDSDWERFYNKNKDVFPQDFKNCLQ